jgi:hypothetical protein
VQGADEGDTTTIQETLPEAAEQLASVDTSKPTICRQAKTDNFQAARPFDVLLMYHRATVHRMRNL